MAEYLQTDVVARAEALGVKARTVVEGLRVGDHKSPYRGFSIEFVQHREYVPGDDLRHIDWRVYGRNERYMIKQYEQETNFIAHIVLDASRSMLYGEGSTNKLEYAKLIAATLAYVIVHQRDSAGLHVFDSTWRTRLPAGSQPGHVLRLLQTLESVEPKDKTSVGPLLHELADTVRPRGMVFLISDCFDDPAALLQGLQHLRFFGHEVTVLHVLHPDEREFPFEGMVRFDGLEETEHLLTRPQLIRTNYLRELNTFLEELRKGCEAQRVDYVPIDTSKPPADLLSTWMARRLRVRRI